MSTYKDNVTVTLLYEDDATRNYTFENVADANIISIKSAISDINKNENAKYAAFYSTFISNEGAAVTRIDAAKIVSIEEEEIYSE